MEQEKVKSKNKSKLCYPSREIALGGDWNTDYHDTGAHKNRKKQKIKYTYCNKDVWISDEGKTNVVTEIFLNIMMGAVSAV